MRAVNNTLREIILRERPLTVTNNDSLVLSPPLPSPRHPHSSPLFRFTPSPLLLPPAFPRSFYSRLAIYSCLYILYGREQTLPSSQHPLRPSLSSLRVVSRGITFESNRARICKYKRRVLRLFSLRSTRPLRLRRIFSQSILDSKTFSSSRRPLSRVQAH